MMRKSIFIAVILFVFAAIPATAQQGEWRFATRITSLSFDATTDPIFDSGSKMVSDAAKTTLQLEWQYMISDPLGICTSLTSAPHQFDGKGGDLDGLLLGEVWLTPLTVTLRYEFQFRGGLQPYVGAGLNATFLLFDEVTPALEDYGVKRLVANPGIGWVFEGGLNYDLNQKTFISLDLKFLDYSNTLDLEDNNDGNLDRVAIEASPMEISLGIGWRF